MPCPLILHQNVKLLFLGCLYSSLSYSFADQQWRRKVTKLLHLKVNTKSNAYYIEHKPIYFSSNLLQHIWVSRKDLEINCELNWNSSLREFKGIFPGYWKERNMVQHQVYWNKEMNTLFPSNCHQIEKRQTCSDKQNKISYVASLFKKKLKGQDKEYWWGRGRAWERPLDKGNKVKLTFIESLLTATHGPLESWNSCLSIMQLYIEWR